MLLDTHIHLWPTSACTSSSHTWMTPQAPPIPHPLATRHGISDYNAAVTSSSPAAQPSAFIYVETDRALPTPSPPIDSSAAAFSIRRALEKWSAEPLDELRFLRRIVEGTPVGEGDGFAAGEGDKLVGIVAWAPLHLAPRVFDLYVLLAREVAGPETWSRVVGFRYLLQGIRDERAFSRFVWEESWLSNLVGLGKAGTGPRNSGWTFDVGVDMRSGGVWQLEKAAEMVERVRRIEAADVGNGGRGSVRFVLNHLCKPDLTLTDPASDPDAQRWCTAISRLARQQDTYMKLSGAFSEFGTITPSPVEAIAERLRWWVRHVFGVFGPERIMFGSDWPVCNVNGPKRGENESKGGKNEPKGGDSWGVWKEVVEKLMEDLEVGEEGRERVWWGTGCEVYGVETS
ncbi:uncharacterized protein BDZ99DRAFT_445350 [Mytilinidion resinicola]|uniref:Amidohydrolase-related domain-containing protein n=1 Tax=Mytilinidion resinicola TaxID=574789 RepID=A0A6A6YI09_9PEZI|nr:uncharacterized protein BDZ99DRAFT_445350 [Mytilinidion resinicola]KAF2808163.1 hypothetical protein BDZ99DRAFT_445350 [Mytilinidion resinicola]